ncbi:TetR/AcrR family transcriptional regulator [Pontibacter ruber]|uniref:TetR/AcrR family transcriptional regulator n=1 Tax=Pontibacter ruber TaxID=1343895 RepID=A0ABW5CTQ1_9BACT|nr:TetR/AcrR family transcriptional regulator [Pontibacter ruber]
MVRFQDKRSQSINQLVEAGLKLFSEQGYEATSIRSIAREAGVSLGLMYNYFRSKEELLLEIFRRGNADIAASFIKPTEAPQNQSGIEQHIRQTVRILKEKREFWRLLHGLRLQNQVLAQVATEVQQQTAFIEQHIKENLQEIGFKEPELEAKLLFAAIDGMAQHFLLYENYPIDEVANVLLQKYKPLNP